MTLHWTYDGRKYNAEGKHVGPGPWLDVISAANEIEAVAGRPKIFDEPISTGPNAEGIYTEEYEAARVLIHDDPDVVTIHPLTELAAATIGLAHQKVLDKQKEQVS